MANAKVIFVGNTIFQFPFLINGSVSQKIHVPTKRRITILLKIRHYSNSVNKANS